MKSTTFTPQGTYLLVQVPQSYWDKKQGKIILDKATKDQYRTEFIAKGDGLVVGPCGGDVSFVKTGDTVLVETRGSSEVYLDGETEPYMCIREQQILGKIN